jgi:hypothetical protein
MMMLCSLVQLKRSYDDDQKENAQDHSFAISSIHLTSFGQNCHQGWQQFSFTTTLFVLLRL